MGKEHGSSRSGPRADEIRKKKSNRIIELGVENYKAREFDEIQIGGLVRN